MIFLLHQNATRFTRALNGDLEIKVSSNTCAKVFRELAEAYPEELICWIDERFAGLFQADKIPEIFCHDRIMASYSIKSIFLPEEIGYIDQLPFINIKRGVRYPTWQMSTDIGGIMAKTLLKFQFLFNEINSFGYLLNSIAKIGQQNGLFCYSDPNLIEHKIETEPVAVANKTELFSFVSQHYKTIWTLVLFFCFIKYEKRFPLSAFLRSVFKPSFFKEDIDLSEIRFKSLPKEIFTDSLDVVIPTIGRAEYLMQVIKDLSKQSLVPVRVIIVEQNPDPDAGSEISDLIKADWPFEIIHHFTHKTGACSARNLALKQVQSSWVFLADDDIRISKDILKDSVKELHRLEAGCINLNCKQAGEKTIFKKIKQWGSFGSGTSIVASKFIKNNCFSEEFEHGYGEDADYGMKLRQSGCDIIYHPGLKIEHLKAPMGGFRKKPVMIWEKEKPLPKPSPTIMIYARKYFTKEQLTGYRISLFLKSYKDQSIRNPFTYLRQMKNRWERSEMWSAKLMAKTLE